jgi:tagaturonate reductase
LSPRAAPHGELRQERRVIASVSRAISASAGWPEVLDLARLPGLELVFSNTTEVGIAADAGDDIRLDPPRSFPGRLTRFLVERGRTFGFDPAKGVVVIPCELIEHNGARLRDLVLDLASRAGTEPAFATWLERAVPFCNTLVDRIVPGTPAGDERALLEQSLGYRDELLTVCEPYRLFAIEGDAALERRLDFPAADAGIVVAPDVGPYRERKVRLLNGTHTVMAPAALLAGCETVQQAIENRRVGRFVRHALLEEILPGVDAPGAGRFAREVLERFANPFIRHALFDITLQGTTKMRVRVVPSILRFAERRHRAPASLAFGFAAHLLFLRGDLQQRRREAGLPVPADDLGETIRSRWTGQEGSADARLTALVEGTCRDESSWNADLTQVPGFVAAVSAHLTRMLRDGVVAALDAHVESL